MTHNASWGKDRNKALVHHFKNHSYWHFKEHRKQELQKRENNSHLDTQQSHAKRNIDQKTENSPKKLKYFTSLCSLASSPARKAHLNAQLKLTPKKTTVPEQEYAQILIKLNRKVLHLDSPDNPPRKCEIAKQGSLNIPPRPQQIKERSPQHSITTTTEVAVIPLKARSHSTSRTIPLCFPYFFVPIYVPPVPPSPFLSKRVVKPKETEKVPGNSKSHNNEKSFSVEQTTIHKRTVDRRNHYNGSGQLPRKSSQNTRY